MSSHHFVKEDQEPALLILNAEAISFEKVQELLEWSPTIIVPEAALYQVRGWGIKIDVVICESTPCQTLELDLLDQAPIQFVSFQPSASALVAAFEFIKTKNYKAVNVLIREESDFLFIETITGLDIEVFYQNSRWYFIGSGTFAKWMPEGMQVHLYPKVPLQYAGLTDQLMAERNGLIEVKSSFPFWLGEALL